MNDSAQGFLSGRRGSSRYRSTFDEKIMDKDEAPRAQQILLVLPEKGDDDWQELVLTWEGLDVDFTARGSEADHHESFDDEAARDAWIESVVAKNVGRGYLVANGTFEQTYKVLRAAERISGLKLAIVIADRAGRHDITEAAGRWSTGTPEQRAFVDELFGCSDPRRVRNPTYIEIALSSNYYANNKRRGRVNDGDELTVDAELLAKLAAEGVLAKPLAQNALGMRHKLPTGTLEIVYIR